MKKTFPLTSPGKDIDRHIDSVKNEIRKYIKRERKKKLPEKVDFWDFECRFGDEAETSTSVHVNELNKKIDQAKSESKESIYIEILATPGVRLKTAKEEEVNKQRFWGESQN